MYKKAVIVHKEHYYNQRRQPNLFFFSNFAERKTYYALH